MSLRLACATCKRLVTQDVRKDVVKCEAFPKGIPDAILDGEHQHREAFKGDHGLRWSPLKGFLFLDTPEEIQEHTYLELTDTNDPSIAT